MNLCIDEGNTALKFALFEQNKILHSGTELGNLDTDEVEQIIISSVLSDSAAIAWCQQKGLSFHLLSSQSKLPFRLNYNTPETLGNDRLAAIAGAMLHFPGQNNLVIVAGSCITYNFIESENVFHGGAISPGIKMRFKALNHFTARLPLISWEGIVPEQIIGSDTNSSMTSGVVYGAISEIEGIIKRYEDRFANLNIILSGGDAPFLVSQLKNNIFARPELLLEGLNHILNHNDN
jgi:type III pantothenate kinase